MKLLDVMKVNDGVMTVEQLNKEYDKLVETYMQVSVQLNEAMLPVEGDFEAQMAELSKRFDAAKRGLGIVNKLPNGPQKTMHARRVMINLNQIRAMLARVTSALDSFSRAEDDYEAGRM